MRIGYIVLHYMYSELTHACVGSIRKYDPFAPVIVVDNGSPEPYSGDGLIIRSDTNRCLAGGMNIGTQTLFEQTDVEIGMQLNNDVLLTRQTSNEFIWAFESDTLVGIAAPMMNQIDADFQYHPCPHEPGETADSYLAETLGKHKKTELPFVDNVAFAIRRKAWEQVGPLEERFTGASWGTNYDYCWRARILNWKVVLVKSAFIFHRHRATWNQLDPNYFDNSVRRMFAEAQAIWGDHAPKVLWRDQSWRKKYLGSEGNTEL